MPSNFNSNQELIQMIMKFVYDSKFKDLGIFSKQYLNSVLYSIFNNTSKYSLAFGDFDGLRAINDKHSISVGDQVMFDALKIIKQILPSETIIARAAGDEFVFLNSDLSERDWELYIKEISTNLSKNSDNLHGLNITICAKDSSCSSNYDTLYDCAEHKVGESKSISQQHENLPTDTILEDKILNGFRRYFNYYRLNEGPNNSFCLPNSFFDTLSSSLVNIVINRNDDSDYVLNEYMEILETNLEDQAIFLKYLTISRETAILLNKLIAENNLCDCESSKLNSQELDNILKFLIRDPLTGEFSKTYFKNYLSQKICSEPEQTISVQLFDLVHLKLSNDTTTHVRTDFNISKLFYSIIYDIRSRIDFTDFEHDSENHLVSFGGKLISIQTGDFTLSEQEISNILEKARREQKILDIVSSRKSGSNLNLDTILSELSEECIAQKHDLKIAKITNKDTIFPLSIALEDSISYFIEIYNEPFSLNSKKVLVQKLWSGMLSVMQERSTSLLPDSVLNLGASSPSNDLR